MKKIRNLLITCFAFLAVILVSCGKKVEEVTPKSMEVTGTINSSYAINEEIDYSQFIITITYSDNTNKEFSVYDEEVTITGDDTSKVGSHTLTISCLGFDKVYNYEVNSYTVTLYFQDGTYDNKTSKVISLDSSLFEIANYSPTANDENYQFAGWFYDDTLTKRVKIDENGFIKIDSDTSLYAGYDINYDNLFIYTINDDDTVKLDGVIAQNLILEVKLTIPKTIKLYPVVEIGDYFMDKDQTGMASFFFIDTVTFEEGSMVKTIGNYAFENLRASLFILPDTIEKIGDYAFSCTSFSGIFTAPRNLTRIGEFAFQFCYSIIELDFSNCSKLSYIGKGAFYNCSLIQHIQLPEGLETIGRNSFDSCSNVIDVTIPSTLSNIGLASFKNMPNLTAFYVSEDNQYYSSYDGNLYSKNQDTFYRYCYAKKDEVFTLPDSVTAIYESAFDITNEICYLKQINFGKSLNYIGGEVFKHCTASFELPASLTNFSTTAFFGWKGDSFKIDSNNPKFTVVDGMLLSKDEKELYSVPCLYKESVIIPDSVETITSGAMIELDNVKYIFINENSHLKRINEAGLVPFKMPSLIAIYINKVEPFAIDNSALYYNFSNDFDYKSFVVLFPDDTRDLYESYWKDYIVNGAEEDETLNIKSYLTSTSEYFQNIIFNELRAFNFTPYNLYKDGYPAYFNDDFNVAYYSLHNIYTKLEGVYLLNLNDDLYLEYNDYLNSFIVLSFESLFNYYNTLEPIQLVTTDKSFETIYNHYLRLPKNISSLFSSSTIEKINKIKATYDSILLERENWFKKLNEFNIHNYSYDESIKFINEYNDYGSTFIKLTTTQQHKLLAIDCSNLIYEFNRLSKVEDNYIELANRYYADLSTYKLGIQNYLYSFFVTNESKNELYDYETFEVEYAKFVTLETTLIDKISSIYADFDINEEYNIDRFNSLLETYNLMGEYCYLLPYEVTEKKNIINNRIIIKTFVEDFNTGLTNENIEDLFTAYNFILLNASTDYYQHLPEYVAFTNFSLDFANEFNSVVVPFFNLLISTNYDNFDENFVEITNMHNLLPSLFDSLNFTYGDDTYSAYQIYNAAVCTKMLKDIYKEYGNKKTLNLTSQNYIELNQKSFGYYDYDNNLKVNGVSYYIDAFANSYGFNTYLAIYCSNGEDNIDYYQVYNEFVLLFSTIKLKGNVYAKR